MWPAGSLPQQSAEPTLAWHAMRFRLNRDEQIQWQLDPMLAHQVWLPILEHTIDKPPLWRFHRRAGNDAAGHQFSVIFYASPVQAEHIFAQARSNPLVNRLIDSGHIKKILLKQNAYKNSQELAATSDSNWPEPLQRQWPLFIMGVSATWLGLIDEAATHCTEGSVINEDLDQILECYEQANQSITELWSVHGQHAFLHHLNAAFGYQPLQFMRLMNF